MTVRSTGGPAAEEFTPGVRLPGILLGSGRMLRLHRGRIVVHQGLGDLADLEAVWADLGHGRHFCRRAGKEALFEVFQFLRHDGALDNFETPVPSQIDDSPSSDAVKKTV